HYFGPDGRVTGMVGDVINEAARRTGIKIVWKLLPQGPFAAFADKKVELWPLLGFRDDQNVHFTRPFLRNSYVALTAGGKEKTRTVHLVSVVNYPLARALTQKAFPRATMVPFPTRREALVSVCEGKSDAVVAEVRIAQYLTLNRPRECTNITLRAEGLGLPQTQLGLASIPDPAAMAAVEALRDEVDRMMADHTMPELLRQWNYYYSGESETIYQEMQAQAATRIAQTLAGALGVAALLLSFLLIRMRHAEQTAVIANSAKSQFLARMSHEIRTPLHGIIGIAKLLRDTPLEGEQREYVDMIDGSGVTLLRIVNDVLDLARIERGNLVLNPTRFSLLDLIVECARPFRVQAGQKGIALSVLGLDSLPTSIRADAGCLTQVLANLLGNALKFTSQGEVIVRIRTESRGPQEAMLLQFEVSDTGIGVAPGQLERIFDKFHQADATIATRFGGTGLGLAITREIVEAMGGAITVESELHRGSKFSFEIPVQVEQQALPLVSLDAAVKEAIHRVSPRASVLLVEDNVVNQRIAKRFLEKEGHTVTLAFDGEQALRAWESQPFAAIFMDCHMPGMDGFEAAAEIRRREKGGPPVPIIALTAAVMQGDREKCAAAGMDDFLAKPIETAELRRILERWVTPLAVPR
ncbi:MAG: ATP-binding protein, partial [Bryobacteraceae bacterium]